MAIRTLQRVILKFKDKRIECLTRQADKQFTNFLFELRSSREWKDLRKQFHGITITKLITDVSPSYLRQLHKQAIKNDPPCKSYLANMLSYFAIIVPRSINAKALIKALSAAPWRNRGLETAYVEGTLNVSMITNPAQNPDFNPAGKPWPGTGYLQDAPTGIGAVSVWQTPGGDGGKNEKIRGKNKKINLGFVDLEYNWNLRHPDLPRHIPVIYGNPKKDARYIRHGTSVLNIVVGQDNKLFGLGVTPNVARTMAAAAWKRKKGSRRGEEALPNAIAVATKKMKEGDVLLIPMQTQNERLPVEYEKHIFDLIQQATKGKNIIVVEAAGDGQNDLDQLTSVAPWLTRTSSDDSGAIIVSACEPMTNERYPSVSIGRRVDCYAWGSGIMTRTARGRPKYFGDTSGAAAIIAGVALSVQAMAEASSGKRLLPLDLRDLLSSHAGNTPSKDPVKDKIGVMPNLKWIRTKL